MPPKKTSAPTSKASAKPVSKKGASKPVSKAASTTSKPASRVGGRPPSSRAGAASKASTPAPQTSAIPEQEDVDMENTPKANGSKTNGKRVATSSPEKKQVVKKGRVDELAGEGRIIRSRSSIAPGKLRLALFIFGTGDMGQFGLGPDELDEIPRPKLHSWFQEQLEEGNLSGTSTPKDGGLETVACGGMHTLAIDEAGNVRSWGINDNAALGRNSANNPDPANPEQMLPAEDFETWPLVVDALKDNFRAVKVAAGDSVSIALSDKGELRAWGSFRVSSIHFGILTHQQNEGILGFDGVPGHPDFQFTPIALPSLEKVKIVQVSCGADHVIALTDTGHVYVWGNGQQQQLGRKIMGRNEGRNLKSLVPERLGLRKIVHVSAGMYHSFAVDSAGVVFAWGLNTFKQTGISPSRGGNEEMIVVPTPVDALSPKENEGAKVVSISGGEHHSLFLFDNGQVYGCGRCDANELGLAEDHPASDGIRERREETRKEKEEKVQRKEKALEDVKAKEGVDEEDIQEAEAELAEAQASLKVPTGECVPEPVRIFFPPIPESYEEVPPFPSYSSTPPENPIDVISAGTRHNLAVSKSGHTYAWGLGNQAQLGLGADTEFAAVPTLVRSKQLRPYDAKFTSAGGQHCVILASLRSGPNDE